jgi:tetratricopeptide (TPR) repeat protein
MKRVVLTIALCVAVSASFAQKKAVSEAQSIAKSTNANFNEARELIKGALTNEETKNDAKTWYVAGFVEDQQFSAERMKQMLGQQPNESVMYGALTNILSYFNKANELDQLPDAKGKVKPKYTKDMKGILTADHVYYINAGGYYLGERNHAKAYDCFEQYLTIEDLPYGKDNKTAPRDSNYMIAQFYAAVTATQLDDHQKAIAALERAKSTNYNLNEVYQYLTEEYNQLKDTVNAEKTLEEGLKKFPEEKFFLLSLINTYIYSDRNDKAITYLNTAIAQEPNNPQLYDVLGRVYESESIKDYDKAAESFNKALAIDPNYTESLSNLGRIYYNQAINKQNEANMLNDNKQYQEEVAKAKDIFKKALPYFEKVNKLKPDDREYLIALRNIYYNLNMNDEFNAIEAQMNQ